MVASRYADALERAYARYNCPALIRPDPLQFLHEYPRPADREIVALLASSLAYGRVGQIVRSVSTVLARLGPHPARRAQDAGADALTHMLADVKHRFADGASIARLLAGAGELIGRHGSLGACFAAGLSERDETILPALRAFADQLTDAAGGSLGHLLADPSRGSACKRLCLMLRWLARRDRVDPGGWASVPPAKLIIPLDTHMHRIAARMGLSRRRAADMSAALEITDAFRTIVPDDPVRYDFALTRMGMWAGRELDEMLN